MRKILIEFVPGLVGGAVGGFLGYLAVGWVMRQGFYAPLLPGALAGLGCGLLSGVPSKVRGGLCAVEALGSCLLAEWMFFLPPVRTDGSFADFLAHFPKQPPLTLIMVGIGTLLGFWWGREANLPKRFSSRRDPI